MKMDATQKRRMWKVAIGYIAISLFVIFAVFFAPEDWSQTLIQFFVFLQPQFLLLKALETNPAGGLIDAIEFWGCIILIPLWSICFGWLYVKFTNWLNHFPVLGKKVF